MMYVHGKKQKKNENKNKSKTSSQSCIGLSKKEKTTLKIMLPSNEFVIAVRAETM